MIQCQNCECFHRDADGHIHFSCDPFGTIKEPECLQKWHLIKINQMVESYQATLAFYRKLAPLQDKLFKAMERELTDMDEGEKWKQPDEEDEEELDHDDPDDEQKSPGSADAQ